MSQPEFESHKQNDLHKELVYAVSNRAFNTKTGSFDDNQVAPAQDNKCAPSYFREEVWVRGSADNWHAVKNDSKHQTKISKIEQSEFKEGVSNQFRRHHGKFGIFIHGSGTRGNDAAHEGAELQSNLNRPIIIEDWNAKSKTKNSIQEHDTIAMLRNSVESLSKAYGSSNIDLISRDRGASLILSSLSGLEKYPRPNLVDDAKSSSSKSDLVSKSVSEKVRFYENPGLAKDLSTPCYKWQDPQITPRASVMLIHGFPAHGKTYDFLAKKLAAEGMVVYAPDVPGLGRAYQSGLASKVDYKGKCDEDMGILAARIKKEHPGLPLIVGGESMGGVESIRLAAHHPELVNGLILSGAAIKNVPHYFALYPQCIANLINPQHKVNFSNQISGYFSDDQKIVGDLLRDPLVRTRFDVSELRQCMTVPKDTLALVNKIRPDIPVLVLQAVDDKQTDVIRSLDVYEHKLQSKDYTVDLFSGRGHVVIETDRMQNDVLDSVKTWLNKQVPPKHH